MTIYEFLMICFTFIDLLLKVTDRLKKRKKKQCEPPRSSHLRGGSFTLTQEEGRQ